MCSGSPFAVIFNSQHDAGGILNDLDARDGGLRVQLSEPGQFGFAEVLLTRSGLDAGVRTFAGAPLLGRSETATAPTGTLAMAWTPVSGALTTRFVPVTGPAAENTVFLVNDFDAVDLEWHPRREEFAVFHVRRNPASTPTTIAMRRFSADGGLLGESDPLVRGFVTLNRKAVATTPQGYLVGTANVLDHVPGDGGTATTGLTVPGAMRAVATNDDDAALLYRATDGGLWFSKARHDGTATGQPALLDPGATSLYSALTFDGLEWRVAFVHHPTQQAWLATLSRTGALQRLEPVTCEETFDISIAALDTGRVAIGVSGSSSSRVLVTP